MLLEAALNSRETRTHETKHVTCTRERRVCDDNGERRGEAQWFQLASPRGAATTTSASSMSIDIASIGTSNSIIRIGILHRVVRRERIVDRGHRQGRDQPTNREGERRMEKREGETERNTVVGRHRERRASLAGAPERKATTIIFHRQKRKGRTPFISPGSVGSHVVGAAGCDTSITDRPACTVASCVIRSYVRLHDTVHVDRWHRTSYITDISAPAIVLLY